MELEEAHRHAVRVGVVLGQHRHARFLQVRCPRREGKSALHVAAGFEERRDRRTLRIKRERRRGRLERDAASAGLERGRPGVAIAASGGRRCSGWRRACCRCTRRWCTRTWCARSASASRAAASASGGWRAVRAHPDAREVGLAVRRPRRRRVVVDLAVRGARNGCIRNLGPLCRERRGGNQNETTHNQLLHLSLSHGIFVPHGNTKFDLYAC